MKQLTPEEYLRVSQRPQIRCVDSDTRSIIYNILKDYPAQDELFLVTQHIASNFGEIERFKKFGIYLDSSVFIMEDRDYVIWIEPPVVDNMEEYVNEILYSAEVFMETYLKGKVPTYYFLNGEFPSRSIYLEAEERLREKFPEIRSLFPLHYDLEGKELSEIMTKEMNSLLGEHTFNLVSLEEVSAEFYKKLLAKEDFNGVLRWLEESAMEAAKDVENPLFIFPNASTLPYDLADKIGMYLYFKKGVPYFEGDRVNQIGLLMYNLMTLDPNTNLLSDRINYLKNLPDMCLMLPKGTQTKYLALNFKHTMNLVNSVKFFYIDTVGPLISKDLDLSKLNIISVEDHYQLDVDSVISEENYKELHKDINKLQRLLSSRDACLTHSNTILFFHEGRLALGYIADFKVSMKALMLPLLPELSHFETTLDFYDIKREVPLGMLLNLKSYSKELSSLYKLFKETYPGSKPNLKPYISRLSLKGILLESSQLDNQYRPSDINSMVLWCLWSPLAKMNRESFFPIISRHIDLKIFREESLYYTFFNTGHGGLSTTINLNKKFMKGEVTLEP